VVVYVSVSGAGTHAYRLVQQRGAGQFVRDALTAFAEQMLVPLCQPPFEHRVLDEKDLRAICRDEGTFFEYYDGDETFTLDLPVTPHGYADDVRERMVSTYASGMRIDAPYVCELPDVELVGPDAIPVIRGGYVFENSLESVQRLTTSGLKSVAHGTLPRRSGGSGPRRRLDAAVSLVGPWNGNYTHWFQDYLARLEGLERYERETGVEPAVLIPTDASGWMCDALRALGYGPDRWIEWDGGRLRVDRFIVSAVRREARERAAGRRLLYSPTEFRWLRDRVVENIDPEQTRPHSPRIYISRADATVRRVTNEDEVMDLLSARGFERYVLGELSYAEQVTLFSDAEAIVSPHGSGLLNQIYADDATVIELFGPKHSITDPAIEYYIADLWGHDYGCVQGDVVGCDTRADLDGLEILLERMLD
jgi:hypothetical protein